MGKLTVTRITHACVLLNVDGQFILTDPWFSERLGYYRGEPLGMAIKDLPKLNGVILGPGESMTLDN
jgi:L-ascorbate metabolism protein UlaG (beta-lactamase superfamily)